MKISRLLITAALAAFINGSSASACSVCGCSLSSDWGLQGYEVAPGFHVSARCEYIDQTDLRSGTHSVNPASLSVPNADEIQQSTLTQSVWLGVDYVASPSWSFSLEVPFYDRDHSTIAPGDVAASSSSASGLGDARLLVRRLFSVSHEQSWGLQLGLKLPTGDFNQNFATGPQAGSALDRGLQLGTGTTDLLVVGLSWFARPATSLGIFAQTTVDQPLAERSDFLPSASLTATVGARWLNTSRVTPQLQLNTRWDVRERGTLGDTDNSGGTVMNLSPGATAELTPDLSAFAFVQLPVYQRLNGLQLQPEWTLSVGFRWKL
jgi:hypothetical protein